MSIWTSEARIPLLMTAASVLLAACFESAPLSQVANRASDAPAGPAVVTVLDGSITVTGPAGYCVDETATRESDNEAFVLIVRCAATRRNSPVLSATVTGFSAPGTTDPGNLARLGQFLGTSAGRAQLSRSGNADDVRIDEVLVEDGALWLRIHDQANPDTFDPAYWRAILPIADRVVTLSVLSAREHPVAAERGLTVLRGFVRQMRTANSD